MKVKIQEKDIDLDRAIKQFNEAFNEIGEVLIDRSLEIEAAKLCILTREHLMLEGLHGTGKSDLANEVFKRIDGATVFKKQLMKGTQAEEIFGPLNTQIYREEARWEFNTEGFLPCANFAFLDEVYRASDMILPSMLGILNEREFKNGAKMQQCPLNTAIGTTNFVSENKDLDAFHDRWLVKVKVQPLGNPTHRIQMLQAYINRIDDEATTVSMAQIKAIQTAIRRVKFSKDAFDLYEELTREYGKAMQPKPYISDRRLCKAVRMAQAATLLTSKPGEPVDEVPVDMLIYCRFGIITASDRDQSTKFQEEYERTVTTYTKSIQEREMISTVEDFLSRVRREYDTNMGKRKALELFECVKEVLSGLVNMPPDEAPTLAKNQERLAEMQKDLDEMLSNLAPIAAVKWKN